MKHYLAFNHEWFEKYQSLLLWLLQFRWFRSVLRIDTSLPIVQIRPNAYTIHLGGTRYQTDFRTHWKYSKRLYYAFKPLWWLMHYADFVLDPLLPRFSFGFTVLTAYPDPNPTTTTVDGRVQRSNIGGTWSDIRTGAGTAVDDAVVDAPPLYIQANSPGPLWLTIQRGIYLFDTSSISATATIQSATFALYGTAKSNTLAIAGQLALVSSNPASNTALVTADYGTFGTTDYATRIPVGDLIITGYNTMTLNAAGLAAISKTSITKFGIREGAFDADNIEPSGAGSGNTCSFSAYFADQTGTANDPKLEVTYDLTSILARPIFFKP